MLGRPAEDQPMREDDRDTLQRALRDLREGLRALFGQEPVHLEIVSELLEAGGADAWRRTEAAALEGRRSAPCPTRSVRRRAPRRRGFAALVLVK